MTSYKKQWFDQNRFYFIEPTDGYKARIGDVVKVDSKTYNVAYYGNTLREAFDVKLNHTDGQPDEEQSIIKSFKEINFASKNVWQVQRSVGTKVSVPGVPLSIDGKVTVLFKDDQQAVVTCTNCKQIIHPLDDVYKLKPLIKSKFASEEKGLCGIVYGIVTCESVNIYKGNTNEYVISANPQLSIKLPVIEVTPDMDNIWSHKKQAFSVIEDCRDAIIGVYLYKFNVQWGTFLRKFTEPIVTYQTLRGDLPKPIVILKKLGGELVLDTTSSSNVAPKKDDNSSSIAAPTKDDHSSSIAAPKKDDNSSSIAASKGDGNSSSITPSKENDNSSSIEASKEDANSSAIAVPKEDDNSSSIAASKGDDNSSSITALEEDDNSSSSELEEQILEVFFDEESIEISNSLFQD